MYVIQRSPGTEDLFDVVSGKAALCRNGNIVAIKVSIETALSVCQHLQVTLQVSAVQHLLSKLSSLSQYEAEEYNRQMTEQEES